MCFVKERAAATVAATAHSAALADERAAAAARCAAIEARLEAETKRVRKLTAQRDAAAAVASDWAMQKEKSKSKLKAAKAAAKAAEAAKASATVQAERESEEPPTTPRGADDAVTLMETSLKPRGETPQRAKTKRSASAMRLKTLQAQAQRVTVDLACARAQLAKMGAELRTTRAVQSATQSDLDIARTRLAKLQTQMDHNEEISASATALQEETVAQQQHVADLVKLAKQMQSERDAATKSLEKSRSASRRRERTRVAHANGVLVAAAAASAALIAARDAAHCVEVQQQRALSERAGLHAELLGGIFIINSTVVCSILMYPHYSYRANAVAEKR